MSERLIPVTPFSVEMVCDSGHPCCNGRMEPTGTVLTCNPPQYIHECTKCKRKESYDKTYPFIDYR